ncbi:YAP-binding/ALF4/Glomulin [Rhypophila sp. PSN 637]
MNTATAIAALKEAKPPASDPFTYLTLIETHLSPEILPELDNILQDADLAQTLGWDLVDKLVKLPGCETCLETIARLGNPREVILKVNESLGQLDAEDGYEADGEDTKLHAIDDVSYTHKFNALLGMLAILHSRIKTKYPSRFLADSLTAVFNAYSQNPDEEMTAAVVNLVHSLSGRRRPTLPSRKSSVNVANPAQDGDASKNAPDPEADDSIESTEVDMQQRMLLSFMTCVLEVYTNKNDLTWSGRLYEFYNPEKIVSGPGRVTALASFREDANLLAKDGLVGQLVSLITDLGLASCDRDFIEQLRDGPVYSNPFDEFEDATEPDDIPLSTGGCIVLFTYWVFSATIFDANRPKPDMSIFPDHLALLEKFLGGDEPDEVISVVPGVVEALVALGLWLEENKRITSIPMTPLAKPTSSDDQTEEEASSDFMRFIHFSTLIGLYHPRKLTKNAAIALAGQILKFNPAQEDRLRILYDVLENCDFASVKAVALNWFRDELVAASDSGLGVASDTSLFASPQAIDTVQYVVFPNLSDYKDLAVDELEERIREDILFYMQAVNFGLFLWTNSQRWGAVLPDNLDATVRERWWEPLVSSLERIEKGKGKGKGVEEETEVFGELEVLAERLRLLGAAKGFGGGSEDEDEGKGKGLVTKIKDLAEAAREKA